MQGRGVKDVLQHELETEELLFSNLLSTLYSQVIGTIQSIFRSSALERFSNYLDHYLILSITLNLPLGKIISRGELILVVPWTLMMRMHSMVRDTRVGALRPGENEALSRLGTKANVV
eukprot:g63716.t1